MKKYLIPFTLIISVSLAGCFHAPSETEEVATSQPESSEETAPAAETAQTHRIDMTANGFSPSEISIKVGDTVNFVNTDTEVHWPASAMHPTHLLLPGFEALGGVMAGSTYAYTFIKTGTWGFHDHLHVAFQGKVIVTE